MCWLPGFKQSEEHHSIDPIMTCGGLKRCTCSPGRRDTAVLGRWHDSTLAMVLSRPGIWNMHSEMIMEIRMCTMNRRMSLYPSRALRVLNISTQFKELVYMRRQWMFEVWPEFQSIMDAIARA